VEDRDRYVRYQQDRTVLAAIARLDPQVDRISVRWRRLMAESAVAAWSRDELARKSTMVPEPTGPVRQR
jgi:hypothetical protein